MVRTRTNGPKAKSLPLLDYQALAEMRYQIRRFLHFSERSVRKAGLEPRQHQLMLALKALPPDVRPRIGELAERLLIQHHSAVELVNRLAKAGFVRRDRADSDRREVLLSLTPKGEKVLRELSLHHRTELRTRRTGTGGGTQTRGANFKTRITSYPTLSRNSSSIYV